MRLFILLFLSSVVLLAENDTKKMYATVAAKSATLYQKPYECSKKKVAYYQHGDVVAIEYCNQYRWCRTKHGYIKRDLLSFKMPYIDYTKQKQIKPQKRETKQKYATTKRKSNGVMQKRTAKRIRLIPYKKKRVVQDPYNEYFYKYQSAELLIEDGK